MQRYKGKSSRRLSSTNYAPPTLSGISEVNAFQAEPSSLQVSKSDGQLDSIYPAESVIKPVRSNSSLSTFSETISGRSNSISPICSQEEHIRILSSMSGCFFAPPSPSSTFIPISNEASPIGILEQLDKKQMRQEDDLGFAIVKRVSFETQQRPSTPPFFTQSQKVQSFKSQPALFTCREDITQRIAQVLCDVIDDHLLNKPVGMTQKAFYCTSGYQVEKSVSIDVHRSYRALCSSMITNLIEYAPDQQDIETLYINMLIYLDRYLANKTDYLDYRNIDNLLCVCLLLSNKYTYDELSFTTLDLGDFTEKTPQNLRAMRKEFSQDINHNLEISDTTFFEYRTKLFNYDKQPSKILTLSEQRSQKMDDTSTKINLSRLGFQSAKSQAVITEQNEQIGAVKAAVADTHCRCSIM